MVVLVVLVLLAVVIAGVMAAGQGEKAPPNASSRLLSEREEGLSIQRTVPNYRHPPSHKPPSTSRQCWQPQDREVEIGSHTVKGGLIYVGTNLPSVSEWLGTEPALIDPSLARDIRNPDHGGAGMAYWPAYESIHPRCRSAYLAWLEGGRSDPGAYIGYVFLYFYGLERRALHDAANRSAADRELPQIETEVQRLLSVYGQNRSFRGYALQFLEILRLRAGDWQPESEPPQGLVHNELSLAFRLAVGQMATAGSPLPAKWALAWARCDGNINLRTPAYRCEEEFNKIFQICYFEKHGEGLRLKKCKRKILARYRPASPSFRGSITVETPYPEVTNLVGPRRKIQQVALACCDALDAYSRWLGRNKNGRGSLLAAALMPPELLASHAPEEFSSLRSLLQQSVGDRPAALLPAVEVLGCWFGTGENTKLTKSQAVQAAHLLGRAGFGFEPDVRFCGQKPESAGQVVVFPLAGDEGVCPSLEYLAAVVLLHLAVMVSAADGEVGLDEQQHLRDHLAGGLELQQAEIRRLGAYLEWLLLYPPGSLGGKKRIEHLAPQQRATIGELSVAVACADGRVDPDEIKMLTKIFRFLGLDPGTVHEWLHSYQTSGDIGPVLVTSGNRQCHPGHPLPTPLDGTAPGGAVVRLDPALVAAKLRESEKAAVTLAGIFDDEDQETPAIPLPSTGPAGGTVEGLDGAHSALFRRLAKRASWPRSDYEDLADELGLLPDGAIDLLNDIAFELCDEPFIEGDNPLEINELVALEILE